MNKKKSPYQKFAELSDAEKDKVVAKFDEPFTSLHGRPMSPGMKKLWEKARRKGGRPRVGRGSKRVMLSVEQGLLERADDLARRRQITRSELFAQGVLTMLKRAG